MEIYSIIAQVIIAVAIIIIWVFRFYNVEREFRSYHLSDLTRNLVGASKIILSTLLIVGIWYPELLLIPASLMGLLMIAAQYYHYKFKHPLLYHVPSFVLLLLCVVIIVTSLNLVK